MKRDGTMKGNSSKRVRLWGVLFGVAMCIIGCLTPIRSVYRVELNPSPLPQGYRIDPVNNSVVFSKEGLQVKVRYLSDEALNAEIPGPENPFTYHNQVNVKLGYVPVGFTVFQVSVLNPTFDKVKLNPEHVVLVTDRGQILNSYAVNRSDAVGDPRNFETYFLSRGVQSGNEQKMYLERMGIVRGTVYHRDSPIFKGKSYMGKIVFDPLPKNTKGVRLLIRDFVLEFGIYDIPKTLLTLEFPFSVEQGIVEPGVEEEATGM